jgi:hypothetical protein
MTSAIALSTMSTAVTLPVFTTGGTARPHRGHPSASSGTK